MINAPDLTPSPKRTLLWLGLGIITLLIIILLVLGTHQRALPPNNQPTRDTIDNAPLERRQVQNYLQQLQQDMNNWQQQYADYWLQPHVEDIEFHIQQGDENYLAGRFTEAMKHYQNGRTSLVQKQKYTNTQVNNTLQNIQQAIQNNHYADAKIAMNKLKRIAPNHITATTTLLLWADIDFAKLQQLSTQAKQSEATEALTLYQQIQTMLPIISTPLAVTINHLQQQVQQQQNKNRLSQALMMLEQQQYPNAIQIFNDLLTQLPSHTPEYQAAERGLAEGKARYFNYQQQQLEQALRQAKKLEEWQTVINLYQQLLLHNPHYGDVQPEVAAAKRSLDWHHRTYQLLNEPLALPPRITKEKAHQLLQETAHQNSPKLNLLKQRLQQTLIWLEQPQPITIRSDNHCQIILKTFGQLDQALGQWLETTLELLPGQYQLVGVREGYRDILVPVSIGKQSPKVITVYCDQPI